MNTLVRLTAESFKYAGRLEKAPNMLPTMSGNYLVVEVEGEKYRVLNMFAENFQQWFKTKPGSSIVAKIIETADSKVIMVTDKDLPRTYLSPVIVPGKFNETFSMEARKIILGKLAAEAKELFFSGSLFGPKEPRMDGVYVSPSEGQMLSIQLVEKDAVVSFVKVIARPIEQLPNKISVNIEAIYTHPDFRKLGHASRLLDMVCGMFHGNVHIVTISLDDCIENVRGFILGRGFEEYESKSVLFKKVGKDVVRP